MIKLFNTLFFLLLIVVSFGSDTTKVLFIGNSITYFNNMPETFEAIANERGHITQVTRHTPGGTGFVHHVENPAVYNYFRAGDWDYIVLQPGSNESPGYSYPIEETLERGRILIDSIYAYNPCAQVLFYEISYGVWGSSAEDLATYNTTMGLIKANLTTLADSTETFFAPAGEAIRTEWNADQTTLLWGGTGDIHPNAKGSYIIACTFYASIFQEPSLGTTYHATLSEEEALHYQELADTTVLNHLAEWRINTYNAHTAFTHSVSNDTLYVNNLSVNIDSLHWDFGDDTTGDIETTHHVYVTSGDYSVQLITFANGCSDTVEFDIIIGTAALGENKETVYWTLYPNPAKDWLTITGAEENEPLLIRIYNSQGKVLITTSEKTINVSDLSAGIYYITVQSSAKIPSTTLKWIKE